MCRAMIGKRAPTGRTARTNPALTFPRGQAAACTGSGRLGRVRGTACGRQRGYSPPARRPGRIGRHARCVAPGIAAPLSPLPPERSTLPTMRPSLFRPLLGVLLCLLLAFDAVGTAAAAVRSPGGGCPHPQSGDAATTTALSAHRPDAGPAQRAGRASHRMHGAAAAQAANSTMHDTHNAAIAATDGTQASAAHAHVAQAPAPDCHSTAPSQAPSASDPPAPAPADPCSCDDGGCACPAACSLVLASPACPVLGARAPADMGAGLPQHARPAPPQPDTLRPPIG